MSFRQGGQGVVFTDPREFLRSRVVSGSVGVWDASGTNTVASASGFFTQMALSGVTDSTTWAAATKKTILSVTGSGYVGGMGGPTGLVGTPSTTFEVTVDGVLYPDIVVTHSTTGDRAVLGPVMVALGGVAAFFTAAKSPYNYPDSIDAGKSSPRYATSQQSVVPWATLRLFGAPVLSFKTSLLIRMASSEVNSTTTNLESSSWVQYMVQS